MQPEAWARLVQVFSPIVYRWARQSGLREADAADVVQDVFVAVAKHIPSFQRRKQQASFRSWLATITRNRVRDQFRRRQRIPDAVGGTVGLQQIANQALAGEGAGGDPLEQSISLVDLDQRIPHRVLELVRDQCDEKTWRAFWATTVLDDVAADVGDRLKMSVPSVYQAKSRVLRRIRRLLDELP